MKHTILLFLFCSLALSSQEVVSVDYQTLDSIVSNPERGFYHHTETHSGNYSSLNLTNLVNARENESITLILRVFYLEDFLNKPISAAYLKDMARDFSILRQAGCKAVIRFAYSKDSSPPYNDARPEIVFTHVRQMANIFAIYSDVISVVQAGFIGAWGEWYYTDHFAGFSPADVDEGHWADRRTLIDELLNVLPEQRMVQIRTPGYKMKIFENLEAVDASSAFNGSKSSRVGHHNDCFVASSSDFGTYVNPDVEKPYLEEETLFTAMGGETCNLAPPYSDCENSMNELARFHWSYLNIDYNKTVLNEWKDQGCYAAVEEKLGYRYRLIKSELVNKINSNSNFELKLELINDGFANPYNAKQILIDLVHSETSKSYSLELGEDMRLWPINEPFEIVVNAGFPVDIEEGSYDVQLRILDNAVQLSKRSEYAIRLLNDGIWNEADVSHLLGLTLNIDNNSIDSEYEGNLFFEEEKVLTIKDGPKELFGASGMQSNLLFWGRDTIFDTRVILRALEGEAFTEIAEIAANIDYFQDINVEEESTYVYQYYLKGDSAISVNSDQITIVQNSFEDSLPSITKDGSHTDWVDLPPAASTLSEHNESFVVRSFFDAKHANFFLYGGIAEYKMYLDVDNKLETGLDQEGRLNGADFLVKQDSLFKYIDGNWVSISDTIEVVEGANGMEVQLPIELLDNIGENNLVLMTVFLNDGSSELRNLMQLPATVIRRLPADLPESFSVSNSVNYPESRLDINWIQCTYCDSYFLERSLDGVEFEQIAELDSDKEVYYDDFLENGTYFYRIRSYNELGLSEFSEVRSGAIGPTSTFDISSSLTELRFIPNPATHKIRIENKIDQLEIYDLSGNLLKYLSPVANEFSVEFLIPGLYIMRSKTSNGFQFGKLIKN